MKPILLAGVIIVQLALVCYSIGVITEQLRHRISRFVMIFLTFGIFFDITATACMIIGSENSPFTLHGILGYSSLVGMLIDVILAWCHHRKHRAAKVPQGLHLYSRYAYLWWVAAYITGAILVATGRS
jgi:uncharacterized repeat protein (TIGR03987 family)